MIVDVHCHYVPEAYFRFIEDADGFDVRRSMAGDETVEVEVGSDRVPAGGVRAWRRSRYPAGRAGTLRLPRWAA